MDDQLYIMELIFCMYITCTTKGNYMPCQSLLTLGSRSCLGLKSELVHSLND